MASSSSGTKPEKDLMDFVFSWSIQDIFNQYLYKNQVEMIPEHFKSVKHYFGSYALPLIEETRAELCSRMEVISQLPYGEIIFIEESKTPTGSFFYNLKVDSWRNQYGESSKEPYNPKPCDLLVLSDAVPEIASDLERFGRVWTFALVTDVMKESPSSLDGGNSISFEVRTSKTIGAKEHGNSLFAIFLTNVRTNTSIWTALHMSGNLEIIKRVLGSNYVVEEICDNCSLQSKTICPDKDDARSLSVLNESQAAAVISSISAVQCSHNKSSCIKLIWGLPGTGKTKTLSVLLYFFLKRSYRVLACAPTIISLTEMASRVLKLVKEPYRIRDKSFCTLGDLLLIGGRTEFEMCDDLKEIWLDYRVEELAECFAPQTGWKNCFESMMGFLENGLSDYHLFIKKNTTAGAEAKAENEATGGVQVSFLKFARNQYKATAVPLKKCINVYAPIFPKKYVMQLNFEKMVHLLDLLESFGTFLSRNDVISAELERHFAHLEIVCSRDSSRCEDSLGCTSATLCGMRSEVINLLRYLSHTLDQNLPNILRHDLVRDFCFQTASIFFCTAASSYSLHEVDIVPLKLLVVDEAIQLKECELAIPLQLEGIQHAIVFGDEWQLPAMLHSKVSEKAGLGRSLYERLRSLGHPKHLLNMQYRMHPKISSFPNAKFYGNQILNAPNVNCEGYERHYLPGPMFGPYSFISICDGREVLDSLGESRKNMVEVAVIVKIVQDLFKAQVGSSQKLTIGIISPYAAQVAAIQEKIGRKYDKLRNFALRVMPVEGFQGGEEDIIIVSTVRSDSGGSIGSLSNPKHCNVALTRARHCLWIMGNDKTLSNSGSCWEMLVRDAKDRNCFFNANEDKELAKVLLEAKKELGQFDDLLNGDSILFKSARWKILFSDNFRKSFGKLKPRQTQKSVINLLLRLSSGWRPKNIKVDSGSSLQLVEQFKVGRLYVISTVDIAKYSSYTQVLKIWDILPLEEIPKLLTRLDGIFRMYTNEFIDYCKLKQTELDLDLPVTWGVHDDIVRFKDTNSESASTSCSGIFDERSYVETSKVKDSLLLMKFYTLSSGMVNHLLSGKDGEELDFPFEVTDRELEVILYPRSTFILGRSGTGKTTILTTKLFRREQQHYFSSEGFPDAETDTHASSPTKNWIGEKASVLRQMFLTVSPMLCSAVKNQISNLKSFVHAGKEIPSLVDMYDTTESSDTPDNFINIPQESYPLVVTFHKFLMMLDGSMENSYFERFNEIRELSLGHNGVSKTFALNAFIRTKEVDYERFSSSYWPHFNDRLTKKLDSLTVFIEIISHIKGGIISGRVLDFQLSREDYVLLSEGRLSTISKEQRKMVYDIFLDYEKKKLLNGEFDLADLVIDLHRRLRNGSYHGDDMDFIYIDEVQDLTMRQISLFKYLCKNCMEGFAFSGDTAQTIARGIDFRFQDIRSLFYKEFLLECGSNGKGKLKEKDQSSISDVLHLNQNFRTHSGILKLSQSVINLLYHFFPLSVDILSPETSFVYGEAPVLLESASDENAIVTIFGNKVNKGGSMTGFGAEQVILVRDESVKKEIIEYTGKQALVLTIVECKGLEFQNTSYSSPMNRYLFQVLARPNTKYSASELKQLYVAVTRTRQRLWICENKGEFSKPIFDCWKKLCLVQVREVDKSLAQAMQVASSEANWSSRGIKLFNEGNYEMAEMCFERAQDSYREKWAKAAGLRASANRMRGSDSELARTSLLEAAEIYDTIGKAELAARCYIDLKEFKRAGMLFLEKCGDSMLEDAGDCFSLAGCWSIAAEAYSKANNYTKCLAVCTTGNLFETGLRYIEIWKERADADSGATLEHQELKETKQLFLERAAIHYHELKDTNNMMKFVRTFNSMDLRRKFLRSWGYLDELMFLEVESGNFVEASSIARLKGDLLLEADMLGKAGLYKDASRLILRYVLGNSLWTNGSKGWLLKGFSNKEELLTKAKLMAENEERLFYEFICMEACSLSSKESSLSEIRDCSSYLDGLKNPGDEIIYSWKILDSHLALGLAKFEWEDDVVLNPKKHAENSISQNKVSIGTLIYFWDLWKEHILNIFKYLSSIGTMHEKEYNDYEEFCMGYFNVCKQERDNSFIYILLNAGAYWRTNTGDRPLECNGDLISMDIHQFVSASQSYWASEVCRVGMEVLEKLEILHKFAVKGSFSIFRQGTAILHIFEVTKWLMDSEMLNKKFLRALQKYSASSRGHFLEIFRPADPKMMEESMVNLTKTELSKNLIREIIIENVSSRGKFKHGQFWRVVMLVFTSVDLTDELYQEIKKHSVHIPKWESFLKELRKYMDSGLVTLSFARKFNEALQYTFDANWRKESDYISPTCFMYVLERLQFMISCTEDACVCVTKSSLIEVLSTENWKWNSSTIQRDDLCIFMADSFDFISDVVNQIVVNRKAALDWLAKTDIPAKKYYPTMVLRVFILIALMSLNYGIFFFSAKRANEKDEITSLFPRKFYKIFSEGSKKDVTPVIGEALRAIGDPMVILFSSNSRPQFSCPEGIFIEMDAVQCREDMFRMLSLDNLNLCDTAGFMVHPRISIPPKEENEVSPVLDIEYSYNFFWYTFNMFGGGGEPMISSVDKLQIMAAIWECICVLRAAITKLNKNGSTGPYNEAKIMLGELNQLSAALSVSDEELQHNISRIAHLFKKLNMREPTLRPSLDSVLLNGYSGGQQQ
ncbi:hypothetical protein MKW92_012567 [Papaver armeniacum]|nr:hypothetical protein MKW92_012567 [Papaver armeniacum]